MIEYITFLSQLRKNISLVNLIFDNFNLMYLVSLTDIYFLW